MRKELLYNLYLWTGLEDFFSTTIFSHVTRFRIHFSINTFVDFLQRRTAWKFEISITV